MSLEILTCAYKECETVSHVLDDDGEDDDDDDDDEGMG